jgi:hypothetical protein
MTAVALIISGTDLARPTLRRSKYFTIVSGME